MSVHPVMRQNFAGKRHPIFYNIWDPIVSWSSWSSWSSKSVHLSRGMCLDSTNKANFKGATRKFVPRLVHTFVFCICIFNCICIYIICAQMYYICAHICGGAQTHLFYSSQEKILCTDLWSHKIFCNSLWLKKYCRDHINILCTHFRSHKYLWGQKILCHKLYFVLQTALSVHLWSQTIFLASRNIVDSFVFTFFWQQRSRMPHFFHAHFGGVWTDLSHHCSSLRKQIVG